MIIGIGTDLISIQRIQAALERHGQRFVQRVLHPSEQERYKRSARPADYLAKRFAAKEAASKALGTGIGQVSWQDFLVTNNGAGAPELELFGAAKRRMEDKGGTSIHLSLADEAGMALAFVVVSA